MDESAVSEEGSTPQLAYESSFKRPVPQWMVWMFMVFAGGGGAVITRQQVTSTNQDNMSIISSLRSQIEGANQRCNELRMQDMRDDMHRADDKR